MELFTKMSIVLSVDVEPPAGHSGSPPLPDPCDFLRQNPEASCDNIGETVNDQNGDAYGDRDSGDAYGDRDSGDAYGDRDSGNGYGSGNFGDAHGNGNSGDESGNGYGDHVEEEGADNDHENACPGEETVSDPLFSHSLLWRTFIARLPVLLQIILFLLTKLLIVYNLLLRWLCYSVTSTCAANSSPRDPVEMLSFELLRQQPQQ